jgi:lysophospholipase L1-like esterase
MIRRFVVTAVFLLIVAPGLAQAQLAHSYYVALGDSLARGIQPLPNGTLVETNQGYVDDLYGALRLKHPSLRLAKLGCNGETTTTMLSGGGPCVYPAGSQLAQAVAFIHTHKVALITITIGGDNVQHCISLAGVIDFQCLQDGVTAIANDLPAILTALRVAAGPTVPIVGANFYDPILAAWVLLPQPQGPELAQQSLLLITQGLFGIPGLNPLVEGIYAAFGVRLADVGAAFRITDFSLVPVLNIPRNVFIELTRTWMGAPPPRGPDTHPNAAGYLTIAGAFYKAIGGF